MAGERVSVEGILLIGGYDDRSEIELYTNLCRIGERKLEWV